MYIARACVSGVRCKLHIQSLEELLLEYILLVLTYMNTKIYPLHFVHLFNFAMLSRYIPILCIIS